MRGKRYSICETCHAPCCVVTTVVLTDEEIKAVKAGRVNWKTRYERNRDNHKKLMVLDRTETGECVYFDKETGRCKIYKKKRPEACRTWFCGRGTELDFQYHHLVDLEREHDETDPVIKTVMDILYKCI